MTNMEPRALLEARVTRWEGGLLEGVDCCPACRSDQRRIHASGVFDHLKASQGDAWSVWRCGRCASLYLDPRPDRVSLGFAYGSYYTHGAEQVPETARSRSLGWRLVHGYMNQRFGASIEGGIAAGFLFFAAIEPLRIKLDYHGRHLFLVGHGTEGRSVLDVGCGNGEFMSRAVELGWRATGIDPDPVAVAACRKAGLDGHVGFLHEMPSEAARAYDVITMRHSIEHVPDPAAQLRACKAWLKPGGMVWLAWPNPLGMGVRLFRSAWRGLEVPRHLCVPSATQVVALLRENGYRDIRVHRRGHHARNIALESGRIARSRPGWVNTVRARLAPLVGLLADVAATMHPRWGEELVVTARSPDGHQ